MPEGTPYTGRFAPSPTGPLHAGSLVAALASYLDARHHQGRWLLRMEDLDPPRENPEAARAILSTLEAVHLHWDGKVEWQSTRHEAYSEALAQLDNAGLIYACDCSRRDIRENEGIYPGTCRNRRLTPESEFALRCMTDHRLIEFDDLFQGPQQADIEAETGDFVVLRKDGLFAYQLAVTVDDAWQNISHVIRGIDLLDSTPRQIYLQGILGVHTPRYGHIPVIINQDNQKLSKQHFARPVNDREPEHALMGALYYLRQNPDPALTGCNCDDILRWAIENWNPEAFRGMTTLRENADDA